MADSNKAFYVTSVSNGLVLANQPNSRPPSVVASNIGDKGDDEKWIIEAGDKPNVVALRCASNGKYLRAEGGGNWSKVVTGDKQWWTMSSDRVLAPGACSLSPVDYPNAYLNHFRGQPVPKGHAGMTVHMWQWEVKHPQWFSWYMLDTNASFNPLASGNNAQETNQSGTKQADLDAKLKALEERESALSEKEKARSTEWDDKTKALEERDSALSKKEQTSSTEWDDKTKDLQDRQAKSAKEEEERTTSYDQKLKDLQEREAALSRQEEKAKSSKDKASEDDKSNDNEAQAKREADIQRKQDDLSSAEQKLAADRAALQKSQSDLAKREKDIAQRQKKLEASKASDASSTNGDTASDKDAEQRLEQTQKENASLEQRLARLEDQLARMARSPEKSSTGKAQPNGTAKTPKSKVDASPPGCGYKHYKPPRKLERKLIGYLYE